MKLKHFSLIVGLLFLSALALVGLSHNDKVEQSFQGISNDTPSVTAGTYRTYEFFVASTTPFAKQATTTTATSTNIVPFTDTAGRIDNGYFVIAGAKKVTLYFGRGGATGPNAGSTLYKVQVSPDGVTWNDYNKLISNTANTNAQTLTRVSSSTISAATSTTVVSLDVENDSFYAVRCIVVETTDGEHTCSAGAEY